MLGNAWTWEGCEWSPSELEVSQGCIGQSTWRCHSSTFEFDQWAKEKLRDGGEVMLVMIQFSERKEGEKCCSPVSVESESYDSSPRGVLTQKLSLGGSEECFGVMTAWLEKWNLVKKKFLIVVLFMSLYTIASNGANIIVFQSELNEPAVQNFEILSFWTRRALRFARESEPEAGLYFWGRPAATSVGWALLSNP